MGELPQDDAIQLALRSKARRRRGQISDCAAAAYLGEYELRRASRGDWGIFLRGTKVRVGTVLKTANPFVRALMGTMDWAQRRKQHPRRVVGDVRPASTESTPA